MYISKSMPLKVIQPVGQTWKEWTWSKGDFLSRVAAAYIINRINQGECPLFYVYCIWKVFYSDVNF